VIEPKEKLGDIILDVKAETGIHINLQKDEIFKLSGFLITLPLSIKYSC